MSEHHTHTNLLDVDEAWAAEWAAEGVAAIERYLAKHAAFADYLRARGDLHSDDGDRRTDA
jgi:predicted nucleic-acid-binding protein